jgi:integrase
MAAYKLTATKVDRFKPTKNDESLADGNGLYIRFRRGVANGLTRTWIYTYKISTKSIYVTLGDHDASLPDFESGLYRLAPGVRLTLETARRIGAELSDWRKRGLDPKAHIAAQSLRHEEALESETKRLAALDAATANDRKTVQDLFDAWITDGVRRKDGNAALQRTFSVDVLPTIGAVAVKDLTEQHLRGVLRALVDRGVNRSAVMLRDELTQMFRWARKRQPWRKLLVEGDPMDLIEIDKIVAPDFDMENQRTRVLPDTEIIELRDILARRQAEYEAAPNKRTVPQVLEPTTQRAVWIMLSTMCRVGETSMARWEHVDLKAGTWFIPKANVKDNVGDLTVYLSAFSLEQFRQLHKLTGHTDWCFPARSEEKHIDVKAITKQLRDRQAMFNKKRDGTPREPLKNRVSDNTMVLGGGKNGAWTSHDLRRTGATTMQKLGISLDIIDRCQNHVLAGSKVRRHYLHHDYAEEKRAAWAALGRRIEQVLAGSAGAEIIAFPRASA